MWIEAVQKRPLNDNPDDFPLAMVAGTGRSGTGFSAHLLRFLRIDAGHEAYWTVGNTPLNYTVDVDCSWMAVPDLKFFVEELNRPVAHVVRHPVDVINSLLGIGFFNPTLVIHEKYRQYAEAYMLNTGFKCSDHSELDCCLYWYWMWNEAILEYVGREVPPFMVENFDDVEQINEFVELLGFKADPEDIDRFMKNYDQYKTINTRSRKTLTWDDMSSGFVADKVEELADSFGYTL